jgi:hypothetical protein
VQQQIIVNAITLSDRHGDTDEARAVRFAFGTYLLNLR